MNINIDNLKKLIESIRSIHFFQRLFSWGKIRQQLIDGVTDLQKMESMIEYLNDQNDSLTFELNTSNANLRAANDIVSRYDGEKQTLNYMIQEKENKLTQIEKDLSTITTENENNKNNLSKVENQLNFINTKTSINRRRVIKNPTRKHSIKC